eukprot:7345793-Heterocapsa_arctica.AAC.1
MRARPSWPSTAPGSRLPDHVCWVSGGEADGGVHDGAGRKKGPAAAENARPPLQPVPRSPRSHRPHAPHSPRSMRTTQRNMHPTLPSE